MITTFTLSNGKEIYKFPPSSKPKIKLENRYAVELVLGDLLEILIGDHSNIRIKTINHYEDNCELI